jgi:GNAT superfamily N-acetyltransferase
MIIIKRTNSDDLDFQEFVALLDLELMIRDGEEHSFYAQFNKIDKIKHAVVAYKEDIPVSCGAIKKYEGKIAEIKRMFVKPEFRGLGIGYSILNELEQWSVELNYVECILETGKKQPEAIRLYQKAGYILIPNYGQYENVENSVCMKKSINPSVGDTT